MSLADKSGRCVPLFEKICWNHLKKNVLSTAGQLDEPFPTDSVESVKPETEYFARLQLPGT